ncbi:hypothetical protein EDD41_1360 [Luteococcus japonicus]|uniref:Helix-turn-helix protein n=1 Tax=Luteococcus japonicus TaxID=33984 RepID=A0A3N1ZTK3_9ACTN|nr:MULTISPECIES: hypothetical protein [Luteococcus]MDN5562489.1 hypothetical protein [Luteococcus sp.]ROR54169.1 hypothetical protein EDD41_1360 [Luteococcus japonicus]
MTASGSDFASVLNDAIKSRGLTLERIRHRLEELDVKVSVATLSYWQNGRSQPVRAHSGRTLAALEEVLELEPGTLVSTAPMSAKRRRSGNGPGPLPIPKTVEEALLQAGLSRDHLRTVSTHVTAMVAPDRTQSSEVIRKVAQCVVGGAKDFPLVVQDDDGDPDGGEEVHGLSNCHVGQRIVIPQKELAVTQMLLPRSLRQGEYIMFEYMTTLAPTTEPTQMMALAVPHTGEVVMEVQFSRGAVPKRVVGYTASPEDELTVSHPAAVELPVSEGLAQLIKLDVPPSLCVVQWEW